MLLQYRCIVFICFTKTSFGLIYGPEFCLKNIITNKLNVTVPVGLQNSNTASFELPLNKPALIIPIKTSRSDAIANFQKEDHKKDYRSQEDNMKKNDGKKNFGKTVEIPFFRFPFKLAQTASVPEIEPISEDIKPILSINLSNRETSLLLSTIQIKTTTNLPVVNKTGSSTKNYPTEKQKPKKNYNGQYEDPGEADKAKVMEGSTNSIQNKELGQENTKIFSMIQLQKLFLHLIQLDHIWHQMKKEKQSYNTNDNHINTKSSEKFASTSTKYITEDNSSFNFIRGGFLVFMISLTVIAAFVYSGFIVWEKIMLCQNRREILINEEEF